MSVPPEVEAVPLEGFVVPPDSPYMGSETDEPSPEYPHYAPYNGADRTSFAYETVAKRWPIILTQVIDSVFRASDSGHYAQEEIMEEGKHIIRRVADLKYDISRNALMEPIPNDGGSNIELYNMQLEYLAIQQQNSWFSAPWLYAECYLYRMLRTFFSLSTYWRAYDPFRFQKEESFRSSSVAVHQLADTLHKLEPRRKELLRNERAMELLFSEMIQMCLWGNASDLSLLPSLAPADLAALQATGAAQTAKHSYIIRNDIQPLWEHVRCLKAARVDIVLDNAGFELYTDFVLADFLVTYTPYVSKVVFHPKTLPWFVSDVLPADFASLLQFVTEPGFFYQAPSQQLRQSLQACAARWHTYVQEGVFELSVPQGKAVGERMGEIVHEGGADWWTTPGIYAMMDEEDCGRLALAKLDGSGLVIFKGDLNYRKLTADVRWPSHTPFNTAIGGLAGRFPILSLRLNKADVCVGLPHGLAERLDLMEKGPTWRWSGKFGLISYCPQD